MATPRRFLDELGGDAAGDSESDEEKKAREERERQDAAESQQQAENAAADLTGRRSAARPKRGAVGGEPGFEEESRRLMNGQDRDTREVRRRERTTPDPDAAPGRGPQPQQRARDLEASMGPGPSPTPEATRRSPAGTTATIDGGQAPDPAPVEAPGDAERNAGSGGGGSEKTFTAEEVTAAAERRLEEGTAGATTVRAAQNAANQAAPDQTADLRERAAEQTGVDPSQVEVVKIDDKLVARLSESGQEDFAAQADRRAAEKGNAIDVEAAKGVAEAERPIATTSAEGGAFDVERVEAFADARAERRERQAEVLEARQSGFVSAISAQRSERQAEIDRQATEELTGAVEAAEGFGVEIPEYELVAGPPGQRGRVKSAEPSRVELGDLTEVELQVFGERPVTPGPGVAPRNRTNTTTQLTGEGPIARNVGVERDLGDVEIRLPVFGKRPVGPRGKRLSRPQVGSTTLEDELKKLDEDIADLFTFDKVAVGRPPAGPPGERIGREVVSREEADRGTDLAATAIESGPRFLATAPTGISILAKDIADFGAEVAGAAAPEFGPREVTPGPGAGGRERTAGPNLKRVDELIDDAAQTAANAVAVGASGALRDPARTGATAIGTLGASVVGFGAASAVGSRTSLATRAALQPGEEALGIGGNRLTRALAGERTAERLFPNSEPLIFSEEAFLRGVSRASDRVSGRVSRSTLPSVEFDVESTFDELRTQGLIERERVRQRGRTPRVMFEGPRRFDVQPGQAGTLRAFDAEAGTETDVDTSITRAIDEAESEAGTDTDADGDGGGSGGRFVDVESRDPESGLVRKQRIEIEREQRQENFGEMESARAEGEGRSFRVQPELGVGGVGELGGAGEGLIDLPGETFDAIDTGRLTEDIDFGLSQDFERLGELEFPLAIEREGEAEREGRFEREAEALFNPPRQRAKLLQETEREREQELELGSEFEFEFEVEPFGQDRPRNFDDSFEQDMDDFTRLFRFERTPTPFRRFAEDFEAVEGQSEGARGGGNGRKKRSLLGGLAGEPLVEVEDFDGALDDLDRELKDLGL